MIGKVEHTMTRQHHKYDSPFISEKHKTKSNLSRLIIFNVPLVPLLVIFIIINIVLWVLVNW